MHAFPIRVRDTVVGTLSLFMATAGPLTSADVSVARFSPTPPPSHCSRTVPRPSQPADRAAPGALTSRITIEQAKGAIAERAGVGMDEAFARLRSDARERIAS